MEQKTLLRAPDVAKIYDIAESTVYSLAQSGILPAIKLGRSVRFDPKAVENAIRKHSDAAYGK